MNSTSFQAWLARQVRDVVGRKGSPASWLLWCDPRREWLELLRLAVQDVGCELWEPNPAAGVHQELLLRDRFYSAPRAARVVWVPVGRAELTWFKVFEIEAPSVWDRSLLDALRDYGVPIRREDESGLASVLAPHAREWYAQPRETWNELTVGTAKGTLVDDDRVLSALAGPVGAFGELEREGRFQIFARRAVEDFGLPAPQLNDEPGWRVSSLARLLATEAAERNDATPPAEGDRIIPRGLPRERALKLLARWQSHIGWVQSLERATATADALLGLSWWARNLTTPPRSRASRAVEQVLLDQLVERLERLDEVEVLTRELASASSTIQDRATGFWSTTARNRVRWDALRDLASAASLLVENEAIEARWKTAADAVAWYTAHGWQLDAEGEALFTEAPDLPAAIQRLRIRLRRAYLRSNDRIGRRFSELLQARPSDVLGLPSAGEIAAAEIERRKGPMAILFLDACRYDLGQRLADLLNEGEPARRAEVRTAVAPLPSITAIGMAFALPLPRSAMTVSLGVDEKRFKVEASGFAGDLTQKQNREKWLKAALSVKDFLTFNDVLEDRLPEAGRSKRVLVVHGAEFDTEGHEGQLELKGGDEHLQRYATAIRRLRDKGYSRIVVVTDHGFFHWQPDQDEIEKEKPTGSVRWKSRRAFVGTGLSHKTALILPVSGSDLEVALPRSVNAWATYGGVGFFHGGATIQELVIPVVIASWPSRATKVDVVLKPVGTIISRTPRMQVQVASSALIVAEGHLARRVVVKVEDASGRLVFKQAEAITIQPPVTAEDREPKSVQLQLVPSPPAVAFGDVLTVLLRDADDDQILARETVQLKVEIDEWE